MIEELILHIGMPKTGTTSIQRALNAAQGGADWTYLDLNPPHSANPVIRRAYCGFAPVSAHPGPRGIQSPQAARDYITRCLRAVRTPRAIVSAEAMMRLPPAAVAALLAHMGEHARSIRAVAYVRPPYSFITSYVQQFYKTANAPLMDVVHRARRPIPADFALWDHALGRDRVTLFPFDGGSVVRHFAEALQLGPLPEHLHSANVSLSDEATRLLVLFRRKNQMRHAHDGRILSRLSRLSGSPFCLHPEALAQVAGTAEATYAWAESRMGWHMEEVAPTEITRSIRVDTDFEKLRPETLDWLGSTSGRSVHQLRSDPEAIADAVLTMRERSKSESPISRLSRRLRLA
jgi:hypothetical protein